jgi:hypothetical protein
MQYSINKWYFNKEKEYKAKSILKINCKLKGFSLLNLYIKILSNYLIKTLICILLLIN